MLGTGVGVESLSGECQPGERVLSAGYTSGNSSAGALQVQRFVPTKDGEWPVNGAENTDGWFIGITPRLVMGAWVGADNPRIRFRSTSLGQGARTAMPIVGDFLREANNDASLGTITRARFASLPHSLERQIDCDLFREDGNIFTRIFGKRDKKKERVKEFGKKEKKGFFKRLFDR